MTSTEETTTMTATQTVVDTITVTEGVVTRKYEQTASRDHDVTLVAGTYPVTTHRSPEGVVTHYSAAIPAVAHDHTASTVEFGGVALAWEQRGGETETYSWHAYSYQVDQINERGDFHLGSASDPRPCFHPRSCTSCHNADGPCGNHYAGDTGHHDCTGEDA